MAVCDWLVCEQLWLHFVILLVHFFPAHMVMSEVVEEAEKVIIF